MDRKNEIWARLKKKMSNKRTAKKGIASSNGTVPPREIVVQRQRLSSEPDNINKQTYKPVQPREFVSFDYPEITVKTLKSACSHHFNLPAKNCDVLVSNKGPSCTNINQIPMRKDKVYLVRFVIDSENEDSANYSGHRVTSTVSASSSQQYNFLNDSISSPPSKKRSVKSTESENGFDKPSYPVSVSVESILNAGKLIQPVKKSKCVLEFESFNIHDKVWKIEMSGEVIIEQESFASGGFREA
ncbi:hypothetical protein SNE40_002999 [Patella caerulea]|uniref:Uncharacterized protein n=1 Tax=Patella caerulea TaxID=87958 RepID=A0AAN8Q833_PATCE